MDYFRNRIKYFVCVLMVCSLTSCGEKDDPTVKFSQFEQIPEVSEVVADSQLNRNLFSIQVAAFADETNAENLKSHLQKSHLPVLILSNSKMSTQRIFRVQVGPFADEKEASRVLEIIKQLGYSEAFIKTHLDEITSIALEAPEDSLRSSPKENKKCLTSIGGCSHPQWSPNGREIAFFKSENGKEGLYTIGTGGGPFSKIIENSESFRVKSKFSWSPSGKEVVFVVDEVNEKFERVETLYLVNKDGSKLTRLLKQTNVPFEILDFKWSPDGRNVAFNANYGSIDAGLERIQSVFIVPINLKSFSQNESNRQAFELIDVSNLEKINWAAGWKSVNEFLFLATLNDSYYARDELAYEVWSYNLKSGQKKIIRSGPVIKNCHSIQLLAEHNTIIYTAFKDPSTRQAAKIIAFNLHSGKDDVLFEKESKNDFLSSVAITNSQDILFIHNKNLWILNLAGRKAIVDVQVKPANFTPSPSGRKICLEEPGGLFTLKLSL